MAKTNPSVLKTGGQIELTLHTSCVKAGALSIAQGETIAQEQATNPWNNRN